MTSKFKVAAAHASSVYLDQRGSIEKACGLIEAAGRQDVKILVFPESFVPGFPYWINLYPPTHQLFMHTRFGEQSVVVPGPDLEPIQVAAKTAGVYVVLGVSERDGGTLYNTQVFIDETGRYAGKHRKLQVTFAERTIWGQGDGSTLKVFDTPHGKIGGLICYEHMMNLARQALIMQGVQIHCAAWPTFASQKGFDAVYDNCVDSLSRAHALSGQCFVIVAQNPVTQEYLDVIEGGLGPQSDLAVGGGSSTIYGPAGLPVAGPHTGPEEKLVVAEIDLGDITFNKVLVDSAGHYSRPEILQMTIDARPKTGLTVLTELEAETT